MKPTISCAACGENFLQTRKDKKFCSRKCQSHSSRVTQNSIESPTKRRHNMEIFDLSDVLIEKLYGLPPNKRLGYMKDLIEQARAEPGLLRETLCNYELLRSDEVESNQPPKLTIAKAANMYCKRFWNNPVGGVVHSRCPEPPTGEVLALVPVMSDTWAMAA